MSIKPYIICTLFFATTFGVAAQDLSKYPFEQGSFVLIRENVSHNAGPVSTLCKEITWFTNNGNNKAIEVENEMNLNGMTISDRSLLILNITNKAIVWWTMDLSKKTGTKFTQAHSTKMKNAIVETKAFGKETYLGYECEKKHTKFANGDELTALMYGDLAMKTELTLGNGGKTFTRIISISLDPPPASKFKIPNDIKITEQKTI
ncbi:MAG: hypothetical protein LBU91_08075 [Bacteroidales bacterium]|jgi:hypothetical protein|nr:hypothetical protein [Bacteroidales bacterium]